MKLMRDDFFEHGFTDGCKGCKAIIKKAPAQAHMERCRQRMEKLLTETEKGANRKRKAMARENDWIASKMEKNIESAAPDDQTPEAGCQDPPDPDSDLTENDEDPNARSCDDPKGSKRAAVDLHHGGKKTKS